MRFGGTAILIFAVAGWADAEPFIPGTGNRVLEVGDDFEDAFWSYVFNEPKSTANFDDGAANGPFGTSANERWIEGSFRGHPDIVERVATPRGGVPGSSGSLRLRTLDVGIPGVATNIYQLEDFIAPVQQRLGRTITANERPSVVTRVYLPEFGDWEDRTGPTFALRASVTGHFSGSPDRQVNYWPGIIIDFRSETDAEYDRDFANLRLRTGTGDFYADLDITTTGWWTFGMSFDEEGRIHYYAGEGTADLTTDDYLATTSPIELRFDEMDFFYFNVGTFDDTATWSTNWIIDDAFLFTNTIPEPSGLTTLGVGCFCVLFRRLTGIRHPKRGCQSLETNPELRYAR